MEYKPTPPPAQQSPLFQAIYALYVSWYVRCSFLPKKDRFTLGQKVERRLLDLLTSIVTAYHTKDLQHKRTILSEANILLECNKIMIRLAKDTKTLEMNWYIEYETKLQEIGKMLGGWMARLNK